MDVSGSTTSGSRNPGPRWGYALMAFGNRVVPGPIAAVMLRTGSLIAMLSMPRQRAQSRRFLSEMSGRRAGWRDCWRHFTAFGEFLVRRFDAADGREPDFVPAGESRERFAGLFAEKSPALLGTFQFGDADLMGFWLARFGVPVRMVRYRVGNSADTDWLRARYGGAVDYLWVNERESLLFKLKEAVESGHCIAMKCDRAEHSSKLETFEFLGRRRRMPFTIYHLAILFDLPVLFAFGFAGSAGQTEIHSSPVFRPQPGLAKSDQLASAREHFNGVLELLESLVRRDPYQWFNFIEALPAVDQDAPAQLTETS